MSETLSCSILTSWCMTVRFCATVQLLIDGGGYPSVGWITEPIGDGRLLSLSLRSLTAIILGEAGGG